MVDLHEMIREMLSTERINVENIVEIDARKLTPDRRARWKCRFGCGYFGKRYSCPPNVPESYDEFLKSYSRAIAIIYRFEDYMLDKIKLQKILPQIESRLISDYPMAFALFPGGCDLCQQCDYGRTQRCPKSPKVRPSLSSVGINVSGLGLKIGDGRSVAIILLD